mmetsp:Transcript_28927/g.55390  ORF Transcript_28927/g.55390 Transcript_28927/m.55390 type:complete len:1169 (-) Transcript_28927:363-3869(-)|eukprot:CAMPEP_0114247188 /NCGR_PEP_ID=MMETSP0058-20121206/12886_1 /TAXON_ID=36894 /ORGANISM="Pyramimonas parkeae, CCMP726" /LENGTH=1168 /DNA_ID=CAMNT_0001360471 /DNA_START=182 /DNA_END=3688 /DNA_ORIENTATION=-
MADPKQAEPMRGASDVVSARVVQCANAWTNLLVARPAQACCSFCGLWILSLVVGMLLLVTGMVEVNTAVVPFWNRSDRAAKLEDAMIKGMDERTSLLVTTRGDTANAGECVHTQPTQLTYDGRLEQGPAPSPHCNVFTPVKMTVLWMAKDRKSNILTPANAEIMHKVTTMFREEPEWPQYCNLIDMSIRALTPQERPANTDAAMRSDLSDVLELSQLGACRRAESLANFLDPLYFNTTDGAGYHLVYTDTIPQEFNFDDPKVLDNNRAYFASSFVGTYNLSKYLDYSIMEYISNTNGLIQMWNIFAARSAKDFAVNGDGNSYGFQSVFYLGMPIDGYADDKDSPSDQYTKIGQWLYDKFDAKLSALDTGDMDIYWGDTEFKMLEAEIAVILMQSFAYLVLAVMFVWVYLVYMLDSVFLAATGMLQILLCLFPSLFLYRVICQQSYFGTLNLISVFIVVGVGVDDIFVFHDDWLLQKGKADVSERFQHTWKRASKAMFSTSLTTMISFFSNAGSNLPAIATFGFFAAMMIFVNYCAVISFFPSCVLVHHHYIKPKPWSRFERFSTLVRAWFPEQEKVEEEPEEFTGLVAFFHHKWAPFIIRYRYVVLVITTGLLFGGMYMAAQIESAKDTPQLLKADNNYRAYMEQIGGNFAGANDPYQLKVIQVSGIDPKDPIDRSGTDATDVEDLGKVHYATCENNNPQEFDASTKPAQAWLLLVCHDAFWGNSTVLHASNTTSAGVDFFAANGKWGPYERKMLDASDTSGRDSTEQMYYSKVTCVWQAFRDWLLSTEGCVHLRRMGLPCHEDIPQAGCASLNDMFQSGDYSRSCEPFPVPENVFSPLVGAFVNSPSRSPTTGLTPMEEFGEFIFFEICKETDFKRCGTNINDVCAAKMNTIKSAMNTSNFVWPQFVRNQYKAVVSWKTMTAEQGIALHDVWEAWMDQMRRKAPVGVKASYQTSDKAWSFYFLMDVLIGETISGILLSLFAAFLVIASPLATSNIIMALLSVFTIGMIVMFVFAFVVAMGWSLGGIEAINFVMVIGLSVDYAIHLSEAFVHSPHHDRRSRVVGMLTELGVSVVSGAVSTLGCAFFMFFPENEFFPKFGMFIFVTIALSLILSLTFFPALLATVGPEGEAGNLGFVFANLKRKLSEDCFAQVPQESKNAYADESTPEV